MATQIFFQQGTGGSLGSNDQYTNGERYTYRSGAVDNWNHMPLALSRGGANTTSGRTTVAGPTAGLEHNSNGYANMWISPPIDTDVTIAGSITFNLWGIETSMSANASINCRVYKIDHATGAFTLIHETVRTTELDISASANNFAETPTSTNLVQGDRLGFIIFFDDAATNMNSGFTASFSYNGPTAGALGDSYLTFTETFGFQAVPSTVDMLWFTDAASDINPGSATEKELGFSGGSGMNTSVTNTAAGPTSPIQATVSAGGAAVEWFSPPLTGFTLDNPVRFYATALESNAAANATILYELAVCNSDGTNPVVWGRGGGATDGTLQYVELNTTSDYIDGLIAGPVTTVNNGQRLRARIYIDDAYGRDLAGTLVTGHTVTFEYDTGSGAGEARLIFDQALTQSATRVPYRSQYPQLLAH